MRSKRLGRNILLFALLIVVSVVAYYTITRYVLRSGYGETIPEYAGSICQSAPRQPEGIVKTCTTNTDAAELIRFYRFYFVSNRWLVNREGGATNSPTLLEFRKTPTTARLEITDTSAWRITYTLTYWDD